MTGAVLNTWRACSEIRLPLAVGNWRLAVGSWPWCGPSRAPCGRIACVFCRCARVCCGRARVFRATLPVEKQGARVSLSRLPASLLEHQSRAQACHPSTQVFSCPLEPCDCGSTHHGFRNWAFHRLARATGCVSVTKSRRCLFVEVVGHLHCVPCVFSFRLARRCSCRALYRAKGNVCQQPRCCVSEIMTPPRQAPIEVSSRSGAHGVVTRAT